MKTFVLFSALFIGCVSVGCDSGGNSNVAESASEDAKEEYRRLLKESEESMAQLDEEAKAAGSKPD
ncbi:hypothetical protein [Rhodopirellula sallentina]|uniref:Secreted protein n=1 Tax=Rhodopirellula sallentina SM41 TaxID=1263870 RepID=M5TVM9_9BACT|nr:hypothetical protein [Rhodopirellula sallentina]EMI53215.1 secreted protein [Rhodopirellula sallentina SM41]